jgi:hypothetical protein
MALTLPYPDLDFVPLDILTAEEMNEIVANYTFIASQFPIGAGALDFPNLYLEAEQPASIISVPAGATVDIQTLTLPAGKWRVTYMVRVYGSSTEHKVVDAGLTIGGVTTYSIAANCTRISNTFRGEIIGSTVLDLVSSTAVTSTCHLDGVSCDVPTSVYMYAFRVG